MQLIVKFVFWFTLLTVLPAKKHFGKVSRSKAVSYSLEKLSFIFLCKRYDTFEEEYQLSR